jgi:hypothetical protein
MDNGAIQGFQMLFTTKKTRGIVYNCAKITQLGDIVKSLSSVMMGILMKNTNDRSMLSLDKPGNSTDWYLLEVLSAIPVTSALRRVS